MQKSKLNFLLIIRNLTLFNNSFADDLIHLEKDHKLMFFRLNM